MKRYNVEIIHEPTGSYLNYETYGDEDTDLFKEFIRDISIVIVDEEEVEPSELDTIGTF